jgi:hypothetical protein
LPDDQRRRRPCRGEFKEVITGGVLDPPGRTVFEKMRHLETRADELRLFLLQQPRGRVRQCVNLVVPALGFEVVPAEAASLVEVGERIKEAAAGQVPAVHPDIPRSTPSTRPCLWSRSARRRAACARQRDRGLARSLDRSPCGSGSSARLAMMLLGTEFIGVVRGVTSRRPARDPAHDHRQRLDHRVPTIRARSIRAVPDRLPAGRYLARLLSERLGVDHAPGGEPMNRATNFERGPS